jgi:hypothetical protein
MEKYIFLTLSIVICSISLAQTGKVYGKINMIKEDNFITLKAQVENRSIIHKDQLSYNLVALIKGVNGNYSNNNQSGKFSLKPQEEKEVSVIRINLNREEELRVYLFVKKKDVLISKDSLFIVDKKKMKLQK